jgi:hypothetical protein
MSLGVYVHEPHCPVPRAQTRGEDAVCMCRSPTIPLNLSSKDQEFLAQLCSTLRSWWYLQLKAYEKSPRTPIEIVTELVNLGNEIEDTLLKFDLKPTQLDVLYDKLHRTGANT